MSPQEVITFQQKILTWYTIHKRDLPWRKTRDPYKILVSEVMSQQTQIMRVIPKYEAWMLAFPTVEALATASTQDVLRLWSGLGYNRRALYLQQCAKTVVARYSGKFPQDEKKLMSLPGIGIYTSRALLCFAFNEQVPVVDTNIRKVISTQFFKDKSFPDEKLIQKIAEELLPVGHASEWNQALMDYASRELKNEKIPVPKQSHFQNSDRYFRGKIIGLLLNKPSLSVSEVREALTGTGNLLSQARLELIIKGLVKDQLVEITNNTVRIASL